MKFVPTEKLKKGMRLAKPIFNKKGVMLYDRNSKLTKQGIESIKNFQLIGIYILEPAEPLPPMTEEDREFERFQTMSVFTLRDILNEIREGSQPRMLETFATEIMKRFGRNQEKITFTQNLRSPEDTVYKHSLNTAILTAAIYGKLEKNREAQYNAVMAALVHDIGSLDLPEEIGRKKQSELTDEDYAVIAACREKGYHFIRDNCTLSSGTMKDITMLHRTIEETRKGKYKPGKTEDLQVDTLRVAYYFDVLTAMKYGEDPQSDIAAYKYLHHPARFMNSKVVKALTQAINIVPVGCTVQLTNGSKGIVLIENEDDILRPFILSFHDNKLYNLSEAKVYKEMQIKDVVKTMDNRHVMTDKYEEYMKAIKTGKAKKVVIGK